MSPVIEAHVETIRGDREATTAFARALLSPQAFAHYADAHGLHAAADELESVIARMFAHARDETRIPDDALDAAAGLSWSSIANAFKKAFTEGPRHYDTPEDWCRGHIGEVVTTIPTLWGPRL